MAAGVVAAARKVARRPLWVKLSPNVADIGAIAKAAEEAGGDALTIANTYPAMSVDFRTRRSHIGNPTGGLSGRAIKPISLRLVYEASKAVRIPIIGLGGIDTGEDVLEYFLVGASAVQVGTASFADPNSCGRIISELEKLCISENISKMSELRGAFQAEKH
jgi:dihydroorotate dehydrogenase (NAD+) catalytic subunit